MQCNHGIIVLWKDIIGNKIKIIYEQNEPNYIQEFLFHSNFLTARCKIIAVLKAYKVLYVS